MNKFLAIILFTLAFSANAVEHKVVAVVNEEIITDIDLSKRVKLIIRSTAMEDNKESFDLIKGQALQVMIDEKLIAAEAKLLDISIEPEEIDEALAGLADKNGLQPSEFTHFLKSNGINKETLIEQITHQLLWNKIVRNSLQPKINITAQEVQENAETVKNVISNSTFDSTEQIMLSEIVIFANNKAQAKTKLKLAQQIVKKIKSGLSFEEMVSQFSQAGSASNKGHLGWVYAAQLMPELANVIKTIPIGEVTPPMIMEDGVHILKIKDRKSNKKTQNVELDDDQIKNILAQRKLEVLVRSHLMQMRNRAFIKINIKTN